MNLCRRPHRENNEAESDWIITSDLERKLKTSPWLGATEEPPLFRLGPCIADPVGRLWFLGQTHTEPKTLSLLALFLKSIHYWSREVGARSQKQLPISKGKRASSHLVPKKGLEERDRCLY
ncbi:Uncharacterised protein [Streptococcus pneumoniae]|nr:Uncharacterised protein [Streptococcus pneumoniae]VJJ46821.1 Uncharacterised protein [Streptococcus pneumoniae]